MIGAVANIVLDPVFIFLFGLGVKGAAIATVLAQMLSAVFAVKFLFGRHTIIRITWKGYSFRLLRRILLLGLSPFLILATDSVMILALNGVLQKYGGADGDNLIAAATIMLSFMQIITPSDGRNHKRYAARIKLQLRRRKFRPRSEGRSLHSDSLPHFYYGYVPDCTLCLRLFCENFYKR